MLNRIESVFIAAEGGKLLIFKRVEVSCFDRF